MMRKWGLAAVAALGLAGQAGAAIVPVPGTNLPLYIANAEDQGGVQYGMLECSGGTRSSSARVPGQGASMLAGSRFVPGRLQCPVSMAAHSASAE